MGRNIGRVRRGNSFSRGTRRRVGRTGGKVRERDRLTGGRKIRGRIWRRKRGKQRDGAGRRRGRGR